MSSQELKLPFIDFSQWSAYHKCESFWFEKYIAQYARKPKEGEQSNALVLGTLVHAGLEHYRAAGTPDIPPEVVEKEKASYETYSEAQNLLAGYILRYPKEEFSLSKTEAPVRFPLTDAVDGLAKIDNYFYLDHTTKVESGLGFGEDFPPTFSLTPGYWLREYKTKDASKHRGNYIQQWRMNMQLNFQMLALSHLVGERVQGALIDVIEKPKPYIPKHTCKTCKTQSPRSEWTPTGEGYTCPSCSNSQPLDTSNKSRVERVAGYYRLQASRTPAVLSRSRQEIVAVAQRMQELRKAHSGEWERTHQEFEEWPSPPARSTERCVDSIFGACEYFKAHAEDLGAAEMPSEYVQIDATSYVQEPSETS